MTPAAATPTDETGTGGVGTPLVALRDVAAQRGGRPLWSGLDLDVAPGELVAVLGPNGVGKSTLLALLLGRLAPAHGEIRVLGTAPGRAGARIGYLPQRRSVDAALRMRGRDVVRLGLDGPRWGVPLPGARRFSARARAAERRVEEVIELVGAADYADRPLAECSGGEVQRLLIAQALAPRPRLLLLDEPLEGLDLPTQAAVSALLSRICGEQGVGVVLVAHDVNPVLSHLDTVVYLAHHGTRVGPPREVVSGPALSALFGTPVEVLTASDGRLVVVGEPGADRS